MSAARPHITVCICTYRRDGLLRRLLAAVEAQETGAAFSFSVVVADNDAARSAEPAVREFAARGRVPFVYCCEPRQNIALARNCALSHAEGEFAAFIDDDEAPPPHWLRHLFAAAESYQAAAILGPVNPHYETEPPAWVVKGRFCERPQHPTGRVMPPDECRTGNVLFRRSILGSLEIPFRPEFGTGREDVDFFQRLGRLGFTFRWCNEAAVLESVPAQRLTRRYMLERALLRGCNNLKDSRGRLRLIATSLVAVPVYSLLLAPAFVLGQHVFMKYCIRFCDHAGRLLALVRLNPVKSRV